MPILSELISNYLETGECEKQLSSDTIKAHRINLRQFLDFIGGERADRNVLNQYIKCPNQHFAPRSAKRKLARVRAFYHEMEICGELGEPLLTNSTSASIHHNSFRGSFSSKMSKPFCTRKSIL